MVKSDLLCVNTIPSLCNLIAKVRLIRVKILQYQYRRVLHKKCVVDGFAKFYRSQAKQGVI